MGIRKVWLSILVVAAMPVARGASWQEDIPFNLTRGFGIVVKGGIGTANNLNFLLDTGAVPSVISQRLASRTGLTGTPGSFALLNKEIEAQYLTVSDVRFGSMPVSRLPMVVVDLAPLEGVLGTRIDAIIGLDIFAGQNFSIDYKRKKIVPHLSRQRLRETPAEILSFEGTPYWIMNVHIGGHPFRMLLDTGADNVVLFSGDTPTSLPGYGTMTQIRSNFAGNSATQVLRPQIVTVGGSQFNEQTILVLDGPPKALKKFDGIVGPAALRIARLEFDWGHKCIRWDRE
jgi:predicted aspartyl protease